jgi:anti-repressor protein
MNGLTVFNHNGQLVTDSREVAEMVDKNHKELLRDIRNYVDILTGANLRSLDFFILHNYKDGKGEIRPCFLITRKGCDMVANKMTGEKGVLFTAAYVTKFEEMERQLQQPKSTAELIAAGYKAALDLIGEMKPKAEQYDKFISGDNYQAMNIVAKALGIGRNKLFRLLRDRRILMNNNTPYQQYIDAGYFVVKEKPIQMGGDVINKPQTYVTAKGVDWLSRLLDERAS